jgi:hypothetical protein
MYFTYEYLNKHIYNSWYNCMFALNNLIKCHSSFELLTIKLLKLPVQRDQKNLICICQIRGSFRHCTASYCNLIDKFKALDDIITDNFLFLMKTSC